MSIKIRFLVNNFEKLSTPSIMNPPTKSPRQSSFKKEFSPTKYDFFPVSWEYQRSSVTVDETGEAFKIHMEAPGLEKGDFKVSLDEGLLEIEAEKKEVDNQINTPGISVLFRTLNLPKNVNAAQGKAIYKDNVLRITIPKRRKTIIDKRTRIRVT